MTSAPRQEDPQLVRLRAWQQAALARFESHPGPSFLAVATPGAGKTTFALTAVQRALLAGRARRFVVVVPTQHLKTQWAQAAEAFLLHVDPDWSAASGALPSDVHGVAVTYQQVAANPLLLRRMVGQALVVLDEIHHAADSRAWGDAVRTAFEPAVRRLCLSGTPFRSDQSAIPFVTYAGDLAEADYEYGYGDALTERAVVRPVYFPRIGGHMEWAAPGGLEYAATFDDPLTRELANQRLRTALSAEGDWLPAVLEQANAQLDHLRARDSRAAGLVIAMDQEHARAIAALMQERLAVTPVVATSDAPDASRKIAAFTTGSRPWIVAVRMVSEGVDIPRLRVGVYATNTVTDLFFRQAVGRLVRWVAGLGRQTAYMFIPDDKRLRTFASGIAEQRRHSLRKLERDDDGFGERRDEGPEAAEAEAAVEADDGQLSLFTALSAVPLDDQGRPLATRQVYEDPHADEAIPDFVGTPSATKAEPIPVAPVPLPEPERVALPGGTPAPKLSPAARRRQLREANAAVVADLVHLTGKSHAELNAELNRKVSIRRITEATVRQLELRHEAALKMLQRRY
ncbi:MAG TPA: DEAD/DEAH box helicase [Polyangia bacterium]|nr:DEAD/DEAH box helicase [Polyangia bacterium]